MPSETCHEATSWPAPRFIPGCWGRGRPMTGLWLLKSGCYFLWVVVINCVSRDFFKAPVTALLLLCFSLFTGLMIRVWGVWDTAEQLSQPHISKTMSEGFIPPQPAHLSILLTSKSLKLILRNHRESELIIPLQSHCQTDPQDEPD